MWVMNFPKIFQPFYCNDIIRIGKNNDGGYLINSHDIQKSKALLSFGIGEDISFEKMFHKLNPCPIEAYDGTIDNIHTDLFIHPSKILKENVDENNITQILDDKRDIFLKCDIDGSEYNILNDLITYRDKFTGIAIEFHGCYMQENLNLIINFIAKIGLDLIHIHVNNYSYINNNNIYIPDVIELSFTSSKNISLNTEIQLPHSLDMPNNPNEPDFKIEFIGV